MLKRGIVVIATSVFLFATAQVEFGIAAEPQAGAVKPRAAKAAAAPARMTAERQKAVVTQYCLGCHNGQSASAGLNLASLDFARLDDHAETAEKIIRKLRAGMMPPPGQPRPDRAAVSELVESLESAMDKAAALRPNPGNRVLQRLNRTEYANSIRELLGIDIDVAALLPPDSMNRGFDNIADVLTLSPALMEGYVRAASKISRLALGEMNAAPTVTTFTIPRTASQMHHVEGAPFGTRGGVSVVFNFPADGEYSFRIEPFDDSNGNMVGRKVEGEKVEISIDGERVALLDIDPQMTVTRGGVFVQSAPVRVQAGPKRVSAAFIENFAGPVDDLIAPIEQTLTDTEQDDGDGITILPHLKTFAIRGPFNITGVSETVSRRKIFTCRPTDPKEEQRCAGDIVRNLVTRAYRRPPTAEDLEGLLSFYKSGRENADFEAGIRTALEAIIASPNFVFRFESEPETLKPGQTFRISDHELASRLSYFLWSTAPDDELLALAGQKKLHEPLVLEQQVRRMLADSRSVTLANRFAAQWLHLSDLDTMNPDPLYYPQFDRTLAESMRREVELFFETIIREDRDVMELLTADFTFVDGRLARHYGIPNIDGTRFRRVNVAQDYRKGLLGKGAILTLTSVADRTSPVMRGKFVMEVLLGTPPPPPPPSVPDLEETKAVQGERVLTLRQRLEQHRASPTCAGCHKLMDPIGLALENFDVTGRWRDLDAGTPIDASAQLFDGSKLEGPASLRQALLNHSDLFIQNFSEKLMMYGLSRRVEPADMVAVRAIVRDAAREKNRFSSFVLGIVKRPQFQNRMVQDSTLNQNER
jgi:mono/diheme cytochrome c family protein